MPRLLVLQGPKPNLLVRRQPGFSGDEGFETVEKRCQRIAEGLGHGLSFFRSNAIPFIEMHLSNVCQREAFRHRVYLSHVAVGATCRLGALGYKLAIRAADRRLAAVRIDD